MKKNKKKREKTKEAKNALVVKEEYTDYAVVFENVSFSYFHDANVLNNVNFKVKKGSYTSIIGHNGSGKSTIARLIIGILVESYGSIYINGVLATDDSIINLRKSIGIVFQNPDNQFIGSTVRDDIAFSLENMCVPTSKMDALIDEYAAKVGMTEFLDTEPENLSGGQKQRVAIAGTLIRKPNILVLDEATAMLDPKRKREIFSIIHQMKQENPELTVISITHEIDEAALSDQLLVLNDGKIVLEGTPTEVFSHIQELNDIQLDVPFFNKLEDSLKKEGIDVENARNIEELTEKLCQ